MDMTLCKGVGCPYKAECYRHTATPNKYRQSYFLESPIRDYICEYYIYNDSLTVEPTESRVDKAGRRKKLKCSFCAPNKGENRKRKVKHVAKPRGKR